MRIAYLFILFLAIPFLARALLHVGAYPSALAAYLSDALWACFLAVLLARSGVFTVTLVFSAWSLIYFGNVGFIQAMGGAVDYQDLGFLLDPHFVLGTLGDKATPFIVAIVVYLTLSTLLIRYVIGLEDRRARSLWMQLVTVGSAVAIYAQFQVGGISHWTNSSFPSLLMADVEANLRGSRAHTLPPILPPPLEEAGEAGLRMGSASNVLLIVLEGITGAYLPPVAERNGVTPSVSMPLTAQWAARGWSVPDFIVHTRQTNRGLYAALCADTPRLDGGQPKSMQLLSAPDFAAECLPSLLGNLGYQTSYIQAAELAFMSKDAVMPKLGFQQVLGQESFLNSTSTVDTGFDWGPTDDEFFEQAIPKIRALDEKAQPWFATLLTVGTHYPYGVSAKQIKQSGSPRDAAVKAADSALASFLDALDAEGILEDTLVVVTSDESHGVPGHWLGKNWGLFFALAPDLLAGMQQEVHSSIDIPNSILDYLGYFPAERTRQGRSVFRSHVSQRRLMFSASTLRQLDEDGVVHSCTQRVRPDGSNLAQECLTLRSQSGRLFDSDYQPVEGVALEKYRIFWRDLEQSAYRYYDQRKWQKLSGFAEVRGEHARSNLALAQHRVSLPASSLLTIEFDIGYRGSNPSGAQLEWLQTQTDNSSRSMPGLRMAPVLNDEFVRVRYTLPHYGEETAMDFVLKLQQPLVDGTVTVRDYRYFTQPLEGGRAYKPEVRLESTTQRLSHLRFVFSPSLEEPGWMQAAKEAASLRREAWAELYNAANGYLGQACAERTFSAVEQRVIQAYLVYYNRPADPGGLRYWANRVERYRFDAGARPAGDKAWVPSSADEQSIDEAAFRAVISAFASSNEYQEYYAGYETVELIEILYRQLFNQEVPPDKLKRYSDAVKAGILSRDSIALELVNEASAEELQVFNSRLAVSRRYTTVAESMQERAVPAPQLSQLIAGVDGSPESVERACAVVHYLLERSPLVNPAEGDMGDGIE